MPALIDLLDQYLFSDAPGLVARTAIQRAWEYTTANSWDKLYLASLDDALSEELPHLSAYSGPNTKRPTRPELTLVLAADLGEAGTNLAAVDQSSRAFLTELARTMQNQRLITINHHNLFTDEYRQILLNLFDHAHTRFKSVLVRSEPAFSAALGAAAERDPILTASISSYLERQFGVKLVTLNLSEADSKPSSTHTESLDVTSSPGVASPELPATLAPESPHEDFPLEPLSELAPKSEPETTVTPPMSPGSETDPNAWKLLNESGLSESESSQTLPVSEIDKAEPPTREIVTPTLADQAISFGGAVSSEFAAGDASAVTAAELAAPDSSPETAEESPADAPTTNPRNLPIRLRVLLATPSDVQTERRLLVELVRELEARARARFGLELELVTPPLAAAAETLSPVEMADIFVGIVWLHFGAESTVEDEAGVRYFAGTRNDFARALEQGSGRPEGWLRTVIYRSIRPPLDLLHLDVAEYARVQQFFERAGAYAGDDLVRVFADPSELINDARARLDAWIYNYVGDLATALTEYGNNSAANGQLASALADYDRAITLYRELDRPEQELALWLQVGALTTTDHTASAKAFNIALRLARRIEDDAAAAHSLRSLGALDATRGDWESALDKYHQALAYVQPNDPAYRALLMDQIDANQALADVAHARGDDSTALRTLGNALTLAQELADAERQSALWSKLGELAAERGDWNQALTSYDNALAFTASDQDAVRRKELLDAQATAHTEVALQARAAGDLATAENAYQSALRANAQGSGNRQQRVALFTALGVLATDRADWEGSIKANAQALDLLDSPGDIAARHGLMSDQARAYQELAIQRAERGELGMASSAYRDALSLYQELDDLSKQGNVLYQLGEISCEEGDWNQANAYFMEALTHLEGVSNAEIRARALKSQSAALQHIGDDYRANNEWGQSEIAYVQARGNLEQLGLSDETGPLLYRLGVVTAAQTRLPEALAYLQQARTRLIAQGDTETLVESLRAQSDTLRRYADMYRGAGDFQSAQGHYRQQLELAQALEDSTLEAEAFHSLGLVSADQGEWDNAVDLYEQALDRLQTPEDEPTRALISGHQLTAYAKIGERERAANEPQQAELAYRSALTLAQTLGDKEREADLLHILGILAIEHKNWDEALVNLRRALGIYNLMPAAPNKSQVIFAIGRAQRGQKQAHLRDTLYQAEHTRDAALFTTAVELARDLGDSHSTAIASQELGNLAAEQSDWEQALARYDEALTGLATAEDVSRRQDIRRGQMNARRARAELARNNAQWGSADADLFVALDLARELDDPLAQGDLVYRRGLVAADQEHWTQAIDLYSEALYHLPEDNRERATVERAQAQTYQALGNSERDGQNWASAEAAYSQSLALRQSLGDLEPQADLMAALGDVAMRQARWSEALPHLNAAHALAADLDRPEQTAALASEIQLATRGLKRQQQVSAEQRGDAFRASHAYALALPEYTAALTLAEELGDRAGQAELLAKLGFVATETGDLETALERYRIAAGMYDAPEDAARRDALIELQAQALQDMGNRAGNMGSWQEASEFYSHSVALLDSPVQENHRLEVVRLQAVTRQNLGDQFQSGREWERALDQFRRAAGLYAIVGASEEIRVVTEREADVLTEQAREAQQANHFVAAQTLYAQALTKFSELQATQKLVQIRAEQMISFRAAGIAADDGGDIPAARRLYRQALGIAEELHDQPSQADLYHRLGLLAARQADWTAALLSYQYALERVGTESELEAAVLADELNAYQELGTSLRIAGDPGGAESNYVRAYTNAQSLNRATRAGELAFLLGTLAADRASWESALGYYDQALGHLPSDDAQRNEIQPYRAFAFQQLGDAQRANGQFAAAASAYTNATAIADEIGDETRQGQLLYRFGLLEAAQGRWDPALKAYSRAGTRLAGADPETEALLERDATFATQALQREHLAAQLDHAAALRTVGGWDDAATAYRTAIVLASELGENELLDSTRRDLVAIYAEKAYALGTDGWWDESRDAYRESLLLAQEFKLTDEVAQRQDDLLALVAASGENARTLEANQDLDDARDAYNRTLGYAREFGDTNAQATALYGLGNIARSKGEWQVSEDYYLQARPLFAETEDTTALVALDTNLERVRDVISRRAQQAEATQSAERAVSEGRYDDAQLEYRTAFGLARGLDDSPATAALAAALVATAAAKARSSETQGDWDREERAHRDALGVAREFDDTDAIQEQQADLIARATARAAAVRATKDWATSESMYRHALSLAHEFNDHEAISARQRDLTVLAAERAAALKTGEDFRADEQAYRSALAVAEEFGDTEAIRNRHNELIALVAAQVAVLKEKRDWDQAELVMQHRLDLAREFGDLEAQADALYALGENAQQSGDFASARTHFLGAAQAYEQAEANQRTAVAQHALNQVETILGHHANLQTALTRAADARAAGNYTVADQEYQAALTETDVLNDVPTRAATRVALAEVAFDQGQWQTSLDHYDAAGQLYQGLEQSERVAELAQEQARVTRRLRMAERDETRARGDRAVQSANLGLAAKAYQQGLELAQTLGDPASAGSFEMSLGQIASAEHRLDDAAVWYDAAAASFAQAQDETQRANARTLLLTTFTALGDEHSAQAEWELARNSYSRAVEVAAKDAPAPQTAHLLARLGFVSSQQNELRQAIEYFDRAINTLGTDDLTHQRHSILVERAQVWQKLGDKELGASNLAAAGFAYERALTETRALNDSQKSAEVLHSLGLVRSAQENWEEALDAHRESYSLVQDLDSPATKLGILVSLAEARAQVGESDAATQDYRNARTIADSLSDTPQAAAIEFALGNLAFRQEHWQDAITHYDAARTLYTASGEGAHSTELDAQQATAYARLGEVLYGQGQWENAETALTSALELDAATSRTDRDGSLYYLRGNAASARSEFEKAIADYDRASAALSDDDAALRDRTLAQLAFALQQEGKRAQDAGDLDRAEMAFTRARRMAEASDNFDQVADLWFRLGILYRAQARQDEALAAFRRAYEFDRIDGNALQQQEIANALAERLLHRGMGALEIESFEHADTELNEALEFANRANNPQLVGSALEALGNSANLRHDTAAAIDYYARAGKVFASIEDTHRWRAISQQQAALLRQVAAQQLDANEFADAENLYRRAALLQLATGDISAAAETHLGLGRACLAQGKFGDALIEFEQADAALDPTAAERDDLFRSFADALEAHGAQAFALAELQVAQSDYSRAAAYRDMLDEPARSGLAWQQLADIALQKHDLENAVIANEQALIRLNTPETMDARRMVLQQQVKILSGIGDERRQNGDWSGADETYRHALAISQEQGDLDSMAELYTMLGTLAATQEHWDEAGAEYTHALDLYDELNLPEAQAATWRRLGDMHRQALQFDRATGDFEMARELYKKAGKRVDEGAMWLRLGHVEGDRSEWDKALDQYQSALHLYNEIGAKNSKPEVYRALERAVRNAKLQSADQAAAQGDYLLEENEFVAAGESYLAALELYQEADEHILRAQMENQLGVALEGQQQNEQALTHYRAALRDFETLGIPEAQVGVLANIGDVQRQLGNWNEAEASYRQALALNEPLDDATRAGELYNSLGIVRESQGDWESAFDHYREAVSKFQSAEMDPARVQAELNMLRARRGAQERAEQDYLRRLELARGEGNLAEAGELLNTLGLLAAEDNRWTAALAYYREAVANFERLEAESEAEEVWRVAQGTVLNNIGDASQQIGAWNDADYAYSRALGMAREIGDRESEAILLANLGVAAEAQQQLPRALDYNLQALESYSEIGDETPRAELLERVGDLQLRLEETTAAEDSYRQALELALQANESERTGRLLKQLGLLAQARGDTNGALAFYERALERATLLEHSHEQQDLWMREGALYLASDQSQDAERVHQAALALAIAHNDESAQAILHTRLGQSAVMRGDWQAALNDYQVALALYEKFDSPQDQFFTLERIGDAHAALEEPVPADEAYRAALELAPRVENANARRLWLARASLAENQNRWQEASEYLGHVISPPDPTCTAEEQVSLIFRRGDAAMLAHQWSEADTSINDAMELANASNERVLYGWGMNRLGLLSQAQRNWGDALENFQEAIEIFRVNELPLGEAHVLNNIARLKLETNDANEADLFAQAALAIAQALDSNREASRSLYTRGLAAIETHDFESARQFLNQAVDADPGNWTAQLQLGNALLASGSILEATRQAESGRGQFPDWELGAQTQLTIASLYQDDTRPFKANLKRTRSSLRTAITRRNVSQEMLDAVEALLRALEGHPETALEELDASDTKPALPMTLEARRFIKTALLALSKSPRRFKGKQVLVSRFSAPKPDTRKSGKRSGGPRPQNLPDEALPDQAPSDETRGTESDTPDAAIE